MAKAFPNSHFIGFDYHSPPIERARAAAKEAGVAGKTRNHADYQAKRIQSHYGGAA
ncbi:hypothetical protein [Mesorhizobium sp. NFR06]|uniref:hypothetical protein n=1 Tax=Mesorhizobium sp. NFR06 TaxID=1566290 RepID=UPI00165F3052|nr:hypothetical protein [Mesorhizobium sp. NFR06]